MTRRELCTLGERKLTRLYDRIGTSIRYSGYVVIFRRRYDVRLVPDDVGDLGLEALDLSDV